MSQIKLSNYSFDKDNRELTLTGYTGLSLEGFLLIENKTRGVFVYVLGNPEKAITFAGDVITLNDSLDLSAMEDSDEFLILYNNGDDVGGTVEDVAITTDIAGTISGKVRGIVKMLADIWDSTNHFFNVSLGSILSIITDSIDINWYGIPTATGVSVATSSTTVLAADANRKGLIFSNLGANNIYLRLDGGTASATTGILLAPNSPPLAIYGGYVPLAAITAIAATGATNLGVTVLI